MKLDKTFQLQGDFAQLTPYQGLCPMDHARPPFRLALRHGLPPPPPFANPGSATGWVF